MLEANRTGCSDAHTAFLAARGLRRLNAAEGAALAGGVTGLSLQFAGEHCTECAAPDCHATCDLFERGPAGRCRRFADGIAAVPCAAGPFGYGLEILFKPWGQVMCVGNHACVPADQYARALRRMVRVGRFWTALQGALRFLPARMQWHVTDRLRGLGNRLPRRLNRRAGRGGAPVADRLLCLLGNPHPEPVRVELSVSGFGASQGGRSVMRTHDVPAGWHALALPAAEIREVIDLQGLFRISLVPLIDAPHFLQVLYFGFAAGGGAAPATPRKVKVLVADLDHTLWDGVLIENPDRLPPLRPGVAEALRRLDERGILLSIASRNNADDARAALTQHGLAELFLHPQINWEPKSGSLRRIAQALNVGLDTVAFIDDTPFERAEVAGALPEVRVYDAADFAGLPERPEFEVPVTPESRGRRALYRQEDVRQGEFQASHLDYDAFLRGCRLRLVLEPLAADNAARVFELVQRTNQLNYSGNRYSREDLQRLLERPAVRAVVMRCDDRFGSYGLIGFAILHVDAVARRVELADLMFSCRIQGKRVEHSFLAYVAECAAAAGLERLVCHYHRTARNAAAGRVFEDLGLTRAGDGEGQECWVLACAMVPAASAFPAEVIDEMKVVAALA